MWSKPDDQDGELLGGKDHRQRVVREEVASGCGRSDVGGHC